MNNAIFILTDQPVDIDRLHICTWDLHGKGALEIGIEFDLRERKNQTDKVEFLLSLPFIGKEDKVLCLARTLLTENSANCKFIFNDTVKKVISIGDSPANGGVVEFKGRDPIAILPILCSSIEDGKCVFTVENLDKIKVDVSKAKAYIRFLIETQLEKFVVVHSGITKNSYLYDLKINEMRNIPDSINLCINHGKYICDKIRSCFCMHVVPSDYYLTYADSNKLKNIRILENDAFNRYLVGLHALEDEYIILFQKEQTKETDELKSYSFFTEFEKERLGSEQIIYAVFANLVCSLIIGIFPAKISEELGHWYSDLSLGTVIAIGVVICMLVAYYIPWSRTGRWISRKFKGV
jgi:hypothetical protein